MACRKRRTKAMAITASWQESVEWLDAENEE